jgi:hypothetical protein
MEHTSARRKYANKYVNVFGNFLYCFRAIQIYLRVRKTPEAGDVRADLFPANCEIVFSLR